jgi:hypothetical protein
MRTRLLRGAAVASGIASAMAFLAIVMVGVPPTAGPVADVVVCILPAGITGLLLSSRPDGRRRHGVGEVVAMTVITYLLGVLLFPVLLGLAALPGVVNGAPIPCPSFPPGGTAFEYCPVGLHGEEAWRALVSSTLDFYELTPLALIVCSPLLLLLVLPSAAWVLLMRRLDGAPYDGSG